MTPKEEEYIHCVECCESLNQSWRIFQDLQGAKQNPVICDAAFRYALVAYAKPYTRSDGIHKRKKNAYRLAVPPLSSKEIELHHQILKLRDQVLAHSDLSLKEAIVSLSKFDGRTHAAILQNIPEQLPRIDAVISLIEHTLDLLYAERDRLLASLPTQTR